MEKIKLFDGELSASQSPAQKTCFFGYLDILGFKNRVKQNSYDKLKRDVQEFTLKCAKVIDQSRCIGAERLKIGFGIHSRIVSHLGLSRASIETQK